MSEYQSVLRTLNPKLYDAIQAHGVKDDALMPWAYQHANPQGRPYHDDWGIISGNSVLKALQPYQKIPRIDCAYRVPLPFKIIGGGKTQAWRLWDKSYPTAPDTKVEDRSIKVNGTIQTLQHALCDEPSDGLVEFAAYIGGKWTPCFKQYKKQIFGKRFFWYSGLKQDLTVAFFGDGRLKSDLMAWFPEVSVSWKVGT